MAAEPPQPERLNITAAEQASRATFIRGERVRPLRSSQTHVLRLQYLNEVEPDLDSVHLASDFGKELFAYVVQAMKDSAG
jgi:hypothetical protein